MSELTQEQVRPNQFRKMPEWLLMGRWPMVPIDTGRSVQGGVPVPKGDFIEAMEALYARPDVRAAVLQNTPVLIELLSRNKEAAEALNELTGDLFGAADTTQRLAPLAIAAIWAGCAAAGGVVGYFSRP